MKKIISLILAVLMLGTTLCLADSDESRTVIGADLSESEISTVYKSFGIKRGDVKELTVTNSDEREYLEGLVDDSLIGALEHLNRFKGGIQHRELLSEHGGNSVTSVRLASARQKQSSLSVFFNGWLDAVGESLGIITLEAVNERLERCGKTAIVNRRSKSNIIRFFKISIKRIQIVLNTAKLSLTAAASQARLCAERIGKIFRHRIVCVFLFK